MARTVLPIGDIIQYSRLPKENAGCSALLCRNRQAVAQGPLLRRLTFAFKLSIARPGFLHFHILISCFVSPRRQRRLWFCQAVVGFAFALPDGIKIQLLSSPGRGVSHTA